MRRLPIVLLLAAAVVLCAAAADADTAAEAGEGLGSNHAKLIQPSAGGVSSPQAAASQGWPFNEAAGRAGAELAQRAPFTTSWMLAASAVTSAHTYLLFRCRMLQRRMPLVTSPRSPCLGSGTPVAGLGAGAGVGCLRTLRGRSMLEGGSVQHRPSECMVGCLLIHGEQRRLALIP
jgi:hypothetical protein